MREVRKPHPDRQAATIKKKHGKGPLATGFLAVALGLASDQGGRRARDPEEDPVETPQHDLPDRSRRPPDAQRIRQTREAFKQVVDEIRSRADRLKEAPSLKTLAETDVTHDDLMEFAETLAQENPNTAVANPKFLELVETMRIEHDGTSYYIYTDSEDLQNHAGKFGDVHLEAMLLLEGADDQYGDIEFSLNVFVETPQGVRPIGRRLIISTPEQIKHRVAEHVTDELARLVIRGFPELSSP